MSFKSSKNVFGQVVVAENTELKHKLALQELEHRLEKEKEVKDLEKSLAVAQELVSRIPLLNQSLDDWARRLAKFKVVVANRIIVEDHLKNLYPRTSTTSAFDIFRQEHLMCPNGPPSNRECLSNEAMEVVRALSPDNADKLMTDLPKEYKMFIHNVCEKVHYALDEESEIRGMACGGPGLPGPAVGVVVALLQKATGSRSKVIFVDPYGKPVKCIVQGRVEPLANT